jgi:hypothetical protein
MAWHIHTWAQLTRHFHVVFDVRLLDLNLSNMPYMALLEKFSALEKNCHHGMT